MTRLFRDVLAVLTCALLVACGGQIERDEHRADAGVDAGPAPQILICERDEKGVTITEPCPNHVYDGFGLPRPDGTKPGKIGGDNASENVGQKSQALGDAYCTADAASRSTGSAPTCCHGADNCYVTKGSTISLWHCPSGGLWGPTFCFKSTAPDSKVTSDVMTLRGFQFADCACASIKNGYPVSAVSNDCYFSTNFLNASTGTEVKQAVCGRPNRGWRAWHHALFRSKNTGDPNFYACPITVSVLPSASCN